MAAAATRSLARRLLLRLLLLLGVGGLVALIVHVLRRRRGERSSLLDLLTGKAHAAQPEQEKAHVHGVSLRSHAQPVVSATSVLKAVNSQPAKKPYVAFISHMKGEAAMEARFLQTELERSLQRKVFLDSDDLRDLDQLRQHVEESEVIVLIQSKSVLSRPFCLVELITAQEVGTPVVGVCLERHAFPYDYGEASRFLTDLDTTLPEANPGADAVLDEVLGGVNLTEVAYKLSSRLPKVISVRLDTYASRSMLSATLADLQAAMRDAKPLGTPTLPFEEWASKRALAATRKNNGARGQHGAPFDEPSSRRGSVLEEASVGAAVAPRPGVRRRGSRREVLDPPKMRVELREPSDLEAFDDVPILLIDGGGRFGAECPVEPSCSFSVPVKLLLVALGAEYTELVIDLMDKPDWLAEVVGAPSTKKLSTPMLRANGKWILDSSIMLAELPKMFPDAAANLCFDPPHLADGAMANLGMPCIMAVWPSAQDAEGDGEEEEEEEEHPLRPLWAPFEAALAADADAKGDGADTFLGGARGLCAADLKAVAWLHTSRQLDLLFSTPPLDWQGEFPRAMEWLGRLMPRLRSVGTVERRLRCLAAMAFDAKMPALAARIPADIREDIKATVEAARAAHTRMVPC